MRRPIRWFVRRTPICGDLLDPGGGWKTCWAEPSRAYVCELLVRDAADDGTCQVPPETLDKSGSLPDAPVDLCRRYLRAVL
jgi:hypothetical protein